MNPVASRASVDDAKMRCWWCVGDPMYEAYHDTEWGVPVADEVRLFEKLALEGFQSGLSWLTILRKRDAFRSAFAGFDPEQVARFRPSKVNALLGNAAIVRHRGKIEATIHNARCYLKLREREGSLAEFVWGYAPAQHTPRRRREEIPSQTAESVALSKELKRRGWRFVGPTTAYAFFQAMGLVNDHLTDCFRYREIRDAKTLRA